MSSDDKQKDQNRRIGSTSLIVLAVAVLALLAVSQIARGVDPVEILATVLFLGIFAAVVYFELVGGVVAAAAATMAYGVSRLPAVDVVGSPSVWRLITLRGASFFAFGVLGSYALKRFRNALRVASFGHHLDHETGCASTRQIFHDLDIEIARAGRYGSTFSVVVLDIASASLASVKAHVRTQALTQLGTLLRSTARTTDRLGLVDTRTDRRIFAILAETPKSGAESFAKRMGDRVADLWLGKGVALPHSPAQSFSFAEQPNEIRRLRNELATELGEPLTVELSR
jgi:GGDEF domain-containing protein